MMVPKMEFGAWIIKHRWWIIAFTLLFVVSVGSGGRFLGFTTDYRYFFSKENPQLQAFEALQDIYGKNDNVLIAIAPKNRQVFTRENLDAVEDLTKASWQVPYSSRVDSITNFQQTRVNGDDLVVEDLVSNAITFSDTDLERVKKIALAEPLLINRLISPNAHVTGINITINLPGISNTETVEVVTFVRQLVNDFRNRHPEIDVYLTGVVMLNNSFLEASQEDMKTLMPAMYVVVTIIMCLLLRSFSGTFTTVLIITFATLTAMGLAGWLGFMLSPPSTIATTIILTLAVADCIHILSTMFHEMRQGRTKHDAIVESIRMNLQPVTITSATTAIGFLTFNFSDSPPFKDLGNIVAMGVVVAYFYSVLFLPALMSILPVKVKADLNYTQSFLNGLSAFVIRQRKRLLWSMMASVIILTAGISLCEFNETWVKFFDTRYAFRTDTDFVNDNLTGLSFLEYSLGAGEAGGISNPEYLLKMDKFADWYRKQPEVLHVNTLTDTIKRLNRDLHDNDSYYQIPEDRNLTAQYLLLYELSLPYGLDLNNQINVDKSSTRFVVTLKNISTKRLLDAEERAQAWLGENVPASMATSGSGSALIFAHIGKRNTYGMLKGTVWALVLISAILIFAFRSLKIGLVSMIPNLVPPLMSVGIWGFIIHKVDSTVSLVTSMAIGIIVDDTVHFLSNYTRARRKYGKDAVEAVKYSFQTVGTPIWITSLVLITGFIVLTFSGFAPNANMGILIAITIALALMADFLFLPPLLMKID